MSGREEEARNKLVQLQDAKVAADHEVLLSYPALDEKNSTARSRLNSIKPPTTRRSQKMLSPGEFQIFVSLQYGKKIRSSLHFCLLIICSLQAAGARVEATGLKNQLQDLRIRLETETARFGTETARLREEADVSRKQFVADFSKVREPGRNSPAISNCDVYATFNVSFCRVAAVKLVVDGSKLRSSKILNQKSSACEQDKRCNAVVNSSVSMYL